MAGNDAGNLPFFRFMCCIAAAIMYFVAFSLDSCEWVRVSDKSYTWGLWKRCNTSDYYDRHMLAPDDQPAYYNGVRTLSCFVLICYVLSFFTLDQNKGLGEGFKPVGLGFFHLILLIIMLGILGGNFKDDDRWKYLDPELGWCFWLTLSAGVLTLFSTLIVWKLHRLKTGSAQKKVTPKKPQPKTNTKPAPKKDTKPKTESKNQVKPSSPSTDPKPQPKPDPKPPAPPTPVHEPPAPILDPKPLSPPVLPPLGCTKTAEEKPYLVLAHMKQGDEERPPSSRSVSLDLQPYDIPEMPGQEGYAGAPDYQKAADRNDTKTPAVVLPSSSVWNRTRKAVSSSMKFLKNYAKSAVGKGGSTS